MKIISDPKKVLTILKKHTREFGNTAEHNSYFLMYFDVPKKYSIKYFDFSKKGGIIFYTNGFKWYTVAEPIADEKNKIPILREALKAIFKEKNTKKAILEDYSPKLHKELLKNFSALKLRSARPNYILHWPLFNLDNLSNSLEGKEFKRMRYARKRFYSKYSIKFKDAKKVDKQHLHELLNTWIQKREANDEVCPKEYIDMIENGFPSCDIRRALFINSELKGLTAGWRVPNSKTHYLFLNIHDYSDDYLGEFITIEHFFEAKKKGYKFLDFGGSDKKLLQFKKKFKPESIYKTYNFSVMRG